MRRFTPEIQRTILRSLDTEQYEYGRHSDIDDARTFVEELAAYWPSLENCPEGKDIFEGRYPVTGKPVDDNASGVVT